jgi:hypothetical protein
MPILLGHLSNKRHSLLNGSVQILACRVPFDKTGICPILPG